MRNGILLSLLSVLCGVLLWVLYPRDEQMTLTAEPNGAAKSTKQENRVLVANSKPLRMESAKKGPRKICGDRNDTDGDLPDMITRLPASNPIS